MMDRGKSSTVFAARATGSGLRALAVVFACGGAGTFACGSDRDRPPPRPACEGDDCPPPSVGATGSGGAGVGGTDGAAGAPGTVTLSGTVVQYTDTQFVQAAVFGGPGVVRVLDAVGGEAEGTFADGSFSLPAVEASPTAWAFLEPASDALHFPTFSPVDASSSAEVHLPLVSRSVIEEIMNLPSVPAAPVLGTAQIVLRVVDAGGAPLEGVSVSAPAAQLIFFAALGTWSDIETQTDPTGLVLLGNVAASEAPGNDLEITLGGAGRGSFLVRAANDAATFLQLRAP